MEKAVSLARYKLTFAQARKLVAEGHKNPVKIFYVVKRDTKFEIAHWRFDAQTLDVGGELCDVFFEQESGTPNMNGWRFQVSRWSWTNPKCDGGFLNYFHAHGWKCLMEQKEQAAIKKVA